MSSFNDRDQDLIVDSIEDFIINHQDENPSMKDYEIIGKVMEAVSQGIEKGLRAIK